MGVKYQGQGRGFPRDTEYGFNQDSADHKREQMASETSAYSDMFVLGGPSGIGWVVDDDFSISASRLMPHHARTAFHFYYAKRTNVLHASYARRLGSRLRDLNNRELSDEFVELCKLTRKNFYSGGDLGGVKHIHQESLAYLGELSVQIKRALDNGCIMHGFVQDIRTTCPFALKDMLDSWGIPSASQPNPYNFPVLPSLHSTIAAVWMRQDDAEAKVITEQLQQGDVTIGRSF